ncbi:MAG TPA: hypothetical protein VM123_14075 [archaeon]|nr:hypothetical protein [archaeon]
MNKKPTTIEDYKEWLKKTFDIEINKKTQNYFDSVTRKIKSDLEKSDFWININEKLISYDQEYLLQTGYPLLMPDYKPELLIKPFDSFLLKTFRKNILDNSNWPEPPENGWILSENWFFNINDLIRTLFVVKYLDGVEFLIDKIQSLCVKYKLKYWSALEAKEEGYYAAHLNLKKEFEIPKENWDTKKIEVYFEIQITTQLQEVIRKLLHKYYEDKRKKIDKETIKWQWNYKSDEFIANYLGHILHYIEGMIIDIRERQK